MQAQGGAVVGNGVVEALFVSERGAQVRERLEEIGPKTEQLLIEIDGGRIIGGLLSIDGAPEEVVGVGVLRLEQAREQGAAESQSHFPQDSGIQSNYNREFS